MKQTFITTVPDKAGAFLEASRIIAASGANIVRVSYNKAVDTHILFIDADGTQAQLDAASKGLKDIGYIQETYGDAQVMLLEFKLRDVPGAVVPVLELIQRYDFNISYISSQENGTPYQYFKMGLLVEDPRSIKAFLEAATELCEVKVIEYDQSERTLDNTVFYIGFVNQLVRKLGLAEAEAGELMLQSNLVMQMLDERNESPYKTFEYIGKFADSLLAGRGDGFTPRLSAIELQGGTMLHVVEPPCGSNTYIYETPQGLLFIDCGFACYRDEMTSLLRRMFPRFDSISKQIAITHPDIDHCGLLDLFDSAHVSPDAWEHLALEGEGKAGYRERNPLHAPYVKISRILTGYEPPSMDRMHRIGKDFAAKVARNERGKDAAKAGCGEQGEDTTGKTGDLIGALDLFGMRLDVYAGNGGHAKGEVIIVDEANHLVFCGDIEVNPEGFTPEQRTFNELAPYLMTSVNTDSPKASEERRWLKRAFDPATYRYCCGHGAVKG